jgi:hypothetical protein
MYIAYNEFELYIIYFMSGFTLIYLQRMLELE